MKRATIEVLEEGEMILGSNPVGRYMVTEFEDNKKDLIQSFINSNKKNFNSDNLHLINKLKK